MCFSAEVSFGASAVISTIGVLAVKKSTKKEQLLFALIPLLFGLQQFSEGWLWLALQNESYKALEAISSYSFILIAQGVSILVALVFQYRSGIALHAFRTHILMHWSYSR